MEWIYIRSVIDQYSRENIDHDICLETNILKGVFDSSTQYEMEIDTRCN